MIDDGTELRGSQLTERVLAAVVELVVRDGFSGLTIDAVVAESGTSRKLVYSRWGSKDALVEAALLAHLGAEQPVPDTGSLREDLLVLVRDLIAVQRKPAGQLFRQLVAEAERSPSLRPLLHDLMRTRRAASRAVVDRAVARGELPRDTDAELLLDATGGIVHVRTLITGKPLRQSDAERVVHVVLHGFTTPKVEEHGPA